MEQNKELMELATVMSDYATRKGIGIAKLVKEYPGLGSEKTFRDMKAGKTAGYDVDAQLANYRAAAALIQALTGEGSAEEQYDNLPGVDAVRLAAVGAMKSWGTDRVVFVDGESGCGKTTSARILCGKYGKRVLMIEANCMWNDSPAALLGDLLVELGELTPPFRGVSRLSRVMELLKVSRRCIIIDEAHHMGPKCLNVIKTLVNRTPGEFVLIGIPEMWAKLYKAAFSEARQLSTNRISARVKLGLDVKDVEGYLKNIFPEAEKAELHAAAKMIRPAAQNNGALAFVRDVSKQLIGAGLSIQAVSQAVSDVSMRRTAKI